MGKCRAIRKAMIRQDKLLVKHGSSGIYQVPSLPLLEVRDYGFLLDIHGITGNNFYLV